VIKNRVMKLEHGTREVDIAQAIADARNGKTQPTATADVERLAKSDRRYRKILNARMRVGIV